MTVYANISGARVSKLELTVPHYGLWAADVELPTTAAIPTACTLTVADLTLSGTVARTDAFAGLRTARIEGGGNGWPTVVGQQEYFNPAGVKVSTIMGDLAGLIGEKVAIASDSSVGTYFFRVSAQAARFLRQLSGGLWWVDKSGVTQLGTARDSSPVRTAFLIHEFDPATGRMTAITENPADWMPGRQVSNNVLTTARTLSLVRHIVSNDGTLRTEAIAA